MSTASYTDVIEFVNQLPLNDQIELVETVLHNLHSTIQNKHEALPKKQLIPLTGMSVGELKALAQAVVAPDHQEQLHKVLAKNSSGTITKDEEIIVDTVLTESDQVALLKARAAYTLNIIGLTQLTSNSKFEGRPRRFCELPARSESLPFKRTA